MPAEKRYPHRIVTRADSALLRKIRQAAKQNACSVSVYVRAVLSQAIEDGIKIRTQVVRSKSE